MAHTVTRMRSAITIWWIVLLFCPPGSVSADMLISEIMYDLSGSDTGREWIEVTNTGTVAADLSGWKLFEANTNHGFTVVQGTTTIAAGASVVFADNSTKFLADWPTYSGTLFDSSFSLSNTGELLSLRDASLIDIFSVTYAASWGAQGDGNTLHNVGDTFSPQVPTPGTHSGSGSIPPSPEAAIPEEDPVSEPESVSTSATVPYEPPIIVQTGGNRTGIAGATVSLEASAIGKLGDPLTNARYLWSFGDGGQGEGEKVQHVYKYPGEYVVMVEVASGPLTGTGRLVATIIPSPIVISAIEPGSAGYIALENTGNREIDLSGWIIARTTDAFVLPKHTVLLSKRVLKFPAEITGISLAAGDIFLISYPNGREALRYTVGEVAQAKVAATYTSPAPITQTKPLIQKQQLSAAATLAVAEEETSSATTPAVSSETEGTQENPQSVLWTSLFIGLVTASVSMTLFIRRHGRINL